MTRFGYWLLVAIWTAPMALLDLVQNTNTTGNESKFYLWCFMINALLLSFALYQAFFRPATANVKTAQARKRDPNDETVMDFSHLGVFEWVACLILIPYSGACAYILYGINTNSTGIVSIASLLWMALSIGVIILSAVQFWHLKSGQLVELEHKMVG